MQQSHRTQLVSGWFDCRIYRNGVAKEARPMKQDGDTVAFSMSFAEYPQEFADAGGAEYIKSKDANGLKRYYVSVKVGRICAFFDKSGKKIDRPKNVDIDGKRYDCIIQYKVLNGDPAKMEPRGLWADAMQMRPSEDITFAPMDDGQQPTATIVEEPAADVFGDVGEMPAAQAASDDTPF